MRKRIGAVAVFIVLARGMGMAQTIGGDVLGAHDLTPSGRSSISGGLSAACLYCHAPHSGVGGITPLWNQTLSTQTYTPYSSTTYVQKGNAQPPLGGSSSLCLSCHDGTVAPGQTVAYKQIPMTGSMKAVDVFGTNLQGSHPFSLVLPIKDAADLGASVAQGKTADLTGAVRMIKGNVECTSCHNPHVQAVDPVNLNFLVLDGSKGQLCLACHDPSRALPGQTNRLAGWGSSAHANSTSKTANQPNVGGYATVSANSCSACHAAHNAPGAARLLRGSNEQDCIACHNGGANVSPAAPNVFAEIAKTGHPFSTGSSVHEATENALLNQNRHSTCVDCHNPHSSNEVKTYPAPPAVRPSQNGTIGISGADGVSVLNPAVNQFETCLRCHGTSTGKVINPIFGYLPLRLVSAADPLNMVPQFALNASSSHPVMHDRMSAFAQPSLLTSMLNVDGITPGRSMGVRILCTDCHNSDDNREFGGTGASGPHGSKYTHILERRYEFSQAAAPGQTIANLFPNPDTGPVGPYALCAKCHSLATILSNSSFTEHARHINAGFSCSVCHTAHGMGGQAATISGERLVNFDVGVVAPNGSMPITYNHATGSCTLTCHGHSH